MEINENQAQVLTAETGESFFKIAQRIQRDSARKIAFADGSPIEIDPNFDYPVILLRMTNELTPEEFGELTPYLLAGIGQAVTAGVITADRIQEIITAFTLSKQPPFPFDFPEGAGVKVFWEGTTTYRYEWEALPMPVEIEEETE